MSFDWITQGGPLMYPLLGCSLIALTITFERALFWWRDRRHRDQRVLERICELVGEGKYDEAESLCGGCRDRVARIFRFGLTHDVLP